MKNFSNLEYLNSLKKFGILLGLEKVKKILDEFGNPQNFFPSIIIGGTNGKGSVCAIIAEALRRNNLKVGLFTSPHLINVNERIKINNRNISNQDLDYLLLNVKNKTNYLISQGIIEGPPTYFETLTICAFLYFAQKKVDISVLEVGMGGRLDATNVVNPLISVITNISKDHMDFLGNTIKEIAYEKAGIIKKNTPVICGCKNNIANRIIKEKADFAKAPIHYISREIKNLKYRKEGVYYKVEVEINNSHYKFSPALLGFHQVENSLIALLTLEKLKEIWLPLDRKKFIEAVEKINWPCRLELIEKKPSVFLDGAHNVEGMKALRNFVEEFNLKPFNLVFGMMKDKEIKKATEIIFPLAEKIILTKFPYYRAAEPEKILKISSRFKNKIFIEPHPIEAFKRAKEITNLSDNIFITGSLYLTGEIKKFLD